MFPVGGIVMNIDKLLVSSAMLTAMCKKDDTDNLKLLEPFVLVCINECTELGAEIPKSHVLELLDTQYAFREMPEAVLNNILTRLSRNKKSGLVSRTKDGRFLLVRRPLDQVEQFKGQEEHAKRNSCDVVNELNAWLKEHYPKAAKSEDDVRECIANFFESRGFDILFDTNKLREATIGNTDATNYQVGRFVVNAKENDAALFQKIVNIAQGVMLASTIYVDTTPSGKYVARQQLKDVSIYLDSTLLLQALNYKTPEQKQSADALLMLCKSCNAQLFVFEQHYWEIVEILTAFKNHDAYSSKKAPPLVGLEQSGYTPIEIDLKIQGLEKELFDLGVIIDRGNKYTKEDGSLHETRAAYIDYKGLKNYLTLKMPGYGAREARMGNDVDAISSIMIKRAGLRYTSLESCGAIFVTTNYDLVRESNVFLKYKPYTQYITPTMSDTDLTTILWVKYGMKVRDDVPKLKLVENALAAISPSAALMDQFEKVAKHMIQDGTITEDMAAFIRYDAYSTAQLCSLCGGDASQLEDTTILTVIEKVKSKLIGERENEIKQAKAKAERARMVAVQAQQNAAMVREKMNESIWKEGQQREQRAQKEIDLILQGINKGAQRIAKNVATAVYWTLSVIVFLVMLFATYAIIVNELSSHLGSFWVVILVIAVCSAITLFLPAFGWAKSIRLRVFYKVNDIVYAKQVKKKQPEIDRIRRIAGIQE